MHEGHIDSVVDFLSKEPDLGIVWIDNNEMVANQLLKYLYEKGIGVSRNLSAYNYIKENKFRKRFILYWIETSPEKQCEAVNINEPMKDSFQQSRRR